MKRLAALLLATTCLTAPTVARAEPISTVIGLTALIASVGVPTAVAGAIGGAIIGTALSVGISMAASALLSKPSEQASDTTAGGSDLSVSYGAANARSAIMGPGATGGHHVYTNVSGQYNDMMDCVFVIGDGQHGKVTAVKYNGRDLTLPAGGLVHGVTYSPPEFVVLATPTVGLTYYSGRYDQVADAGLIAHSNPPGRWTSEHRGRGVAYLVVNQVYAEGDLGLTGVPSLMIETEGLVLYDPRKDSTNGGSGAHRWGQPDTYEPSSNPAVQEYNFRRGILVNGQRVLGMSMSPVNLILQMYFAAANINDEPIPLLEGGTEKRYRCSVAASDDRAASDVLGAITRSTAGFSFERGGQFGPVPGVPQVAVSSLAFTDDDMIVGASARFTKYRSRSELVTATFGQFSDPAQFWVSAGFPPRENTADDAAIGERIAKSLDLTQVFSSSQAQRIAESERRKTLQQGQGVATLPAKWIGVQPGDWLPYNSQRHGNMTVLVTGTTLDTAKQQVTITYERTSQTVYSWTTAGELFPPDVGDPGQTGTLIMSASGMIATGVNLPGDGGQVTPGIAFNWNPIFDPTVDQIDFEIRKVGDGSVLPFTADFPESGSAVCSHGIAAATAYEYRHKLFTMPERGTPWSAWLTVTSGSQHIVQAAASTGPVQAADITGQIIAAQLADAAVIARTIAQNAVTATAFAAGIQPVQISATAPAAPTGNLPVTYFNSVDKKLYRWNGTAWIANVAASDLTGQVGSTQITDAAIIAAKLASQAVTATSFAAGIEPVGTGPALPSPIGYTGPKTFFNTSDGKTYRYSGGAWSAAIPAADVSGQLTSGQIADLAATKLTGQIITTQITDSAITTAKINALAVTAGTIASGAVTTTKLAVGSTGQNLIANSDGLAPIGTAASAAGTFDTFALWGPGNQWAPPGMRSFYVHVNGTPPAPSAGVLYFYMPDAGGGLKYIPAIAGQRYEFSAYISLHRAADAYIILDFYDDTTFLARSQAGPITAQLASLEFPSPSARFGVFGVAPAGTTRAIIFAYVDWTGAGAGTDPYLFVALPYFGLATPNQTEFTPWGPAGVTTVSGGQIVTDSITSTQIAAQAVTSNEIAANTITAGNIASGAISTNQLAANAVTANIIAAGAVSTAKLAVGSGSPNRVPNSDFLAGITNVALGTNNTGAAPSALGLSSDWCPKGMNAVYFLLPGANPTGNTIVDVYFTPQLPTGAATSFPVAAGKRYEASAYLSIHRCSADFAIVWLDSAGGYVGESHGNLIVNNAGTPSGSISHFPRSVCFATAPSNATQCFLLTRTYYTGLGGDPYMFMSGLFFAEANDNQNEATPWGPAGSTVIAGGQIVSNSITGSKVAADTLTAGNIAAAAISTSELAAGAVTTGILASGAVTTDILAASSVIASKIASNNVTADHILANNILAGHIAGAQITANHVGANTIITQSGNIQSLIVDNLHIRNAAVTVPDFRTSGSVVFGASFVTPMSVTIPFRGVAGQALLVNVQVSGSVQPSIQFGTQAQAVQWRIIIAGNHVATGFLNTVGQHSISLTGGWSYTATGGNESVLVEFVIFNQGLQASQWDGGSMFCCVYMR